MSIILILFNPISHLTNFYPSNLLLMIGLQLAVGYLYDFFLFFLYLMCDRLYDVQNVFC